jgi:hypothetical protein
MSAKFTQMMTWGYMINCTSISNFKYINTVAFNVSAIEYMGEN